MKPKTLSWLPLLTLSLMRARAQVLSYTTSVITECSNTGIPTTTPGIGSDASSTVAYSMPPCSVCGCPSCTRTSVFTTKFTVFCPTGLSTLAYTVTETYVGMPTLRSFAAPTAVPYAFTVALQTCTVCGAEPITATMTFPSGVFPYVADPTGVMSTTRGVSWLNETSTRGPYSLGPVTATNATLSDQKTATQVTFYTTTSSSAEKITSVEYTPTTLLASVTGDGGDQQTSYSATPSGDTYTSSAYQIGISSHIFLVITMLLALLFR